MSLLSSLSRSGLVSARHGISSRIAELLQSESAVLSACVLECRDAADLLNSLEDMTARAPYVVAPPICEARGTLAAIPALMRGTFRFHRRRLLAGYLTAIHADVGAHLTAQAEQMVRSGRWNAESAVRILTLRAELELCRMRLLGMCFVLHVPGVRFDEACDSLRRLLRLAASE